MKCPHCTIAISVEPTISFLAKEEESKYWIAETRICPACQQPIIHIVNGHPVFHNENDRREICYIHPTFRKEILAYPRTSSRPPCSNEVPQDIAQEYKEACAVLNDSPTASAALSRRCLQHLLREVVKVKPGDLSNEIQQVIDGGNVPSYIIQAIDAIRNIGNFAAHPIKSTNTGEIFPVEPAEAEWNLEVLEALFDFYCVQPALLQKKRDELNHKLQEAGKKAMK